MCVCVIYGVYACVWVCVRVFNMVLQNNLQEEEMKMRKERTKEGQM